MGSKLASLCRLEVSQSNSVPRSWQQLLHSCWQEMLVGRQPGFKNMKFTSILFSTLATGATLLLTGCGNQEASPAKKLVTNGARWVEVPFADQAPAATNITWQKPVIFGSQRILVLGLHAFGTNGMVALGRLPSVNGIKPALYAANLKVTVNDGEISMFEVATHYPERIDGR